MEWYEILIIAAAAVFVLGVIAAGVVRWLKGKGGCDCGSCSHCSGCPSKKDK